MQVVLPTGDFTQWDKRNTAGAIAVAGIKLMCHFVNNQVKPGRVERVLNIQPVEDDGALLPALPGLHHALVMHQANIIFPLVINDKRRGVDQHFVEAIQPLDTQFEHRQAEKQGDTRAFKCIQLKPLQRNQPLLLQKAIRQLNEL